MCRSAVAALALVLTSWVWADDYADTWGPPIGTSLPLLHAPDENGALRTFDGLSGEQGLLLFMNRSADW